MAAHHSEVRDELSRVEATFQTLAEQLPVTPRPGLRDEILAKITGETSISSPTPSKEVQTDVAQPISNEPQAKQRRLLPWQLGIAASLLVAVLSAAAAWYFRSEWKEAEQQLALTVAQNQEIASQYETASQRSQRLENDLSVLSSPEYRAIALVGTDVSPNSTARVFWNPTAEQLYLSAGNLPVPPTDKQYQLWAIVEGKPVSAGVFDVASDESTLRALTSQIAQASAFAITLEPRGGSPSPTMEAMYVQGAVSDS